MRRGLPVLLTLFALLAGLVGSAQTVASDSTLDALVQRVGAAVERTYAAAQNVIFTEAITTRVLKHDLTPNDSMARRVVYDLRVTWDSPEPGAAPRPRLQRELVRIDGRRPRAKDKPRCTEPNPENPGATDELEFLLPSNQADYVFSRREGRSRVNGREALVLDYRARERGNTYAERIPGEDGCFAVHAEGFDAGRLWIDPDSSAVLRLDRRMSAEVSVRVPPLRRRSEALDVTMERSDLSINYRPVTFADPDETLLLPSSSEAILVFRLPDLSARRESRSFSNYRRFTATGRIVEQDQ